MAPNNEVDDRVPDGRATSVEVLVETEFLLKPRGLIL
jgi:hypothetical protein